jgi:hypothetical protein
MSKTEKWITIGVVVAFLVILGGFTVDQATTRTRV